MREKAKWFCEQNDMPTPRILTKKAPILKNPVEQLHLHRAVRGNNAGFYFPSEEGHFIFIKDEIALFHELVHARQYYRGELVKKIEYGEVRTWWHGEEVFSSYFKGYFNLPWEIEAFSEEIVWQRKWNMTKQQRPTWNESTRLNRIEKLLIDLQQS